MRTGLVDEIVHEVDVGELIFEAPTKASQAWFVKQFGPGVNLGNIPPEEVIPLETLRLGPAGRHAEGRCSLATPSLQLPDVETMPAEDVLRWAHAGVRRPASA
jgi:phosphosulfolactate synthase